MNYLLSHAHILMIYKTYPPSHERKSNSQCHLCQQKNSYKILKHAPSLNNQWVGA